MNENISEKENEEVKSVTLPSCYENPPYEDKTTLPDTVENENVQKEEEAKEKNEDSDDAFKTILTKKGKPKNKLFAVISFVIGVAAVIIGFFTPWAIPIAILAAVFSILSRYSLGYFHPLSVAGISLATVGVVIPIALKVLAPIITALYN